MSKIVVFAAALVLILHGLIHLIGPAVYMRLSTVEDIPYKTTLLGGRWHVGDRGIWLFGLLWVVPAIGFVLAAVAMMVGWTWWQPLLISVALFSLLLSVLDARVAFFGIVVNLFILAMLALEMRVFHWFAG